MLSRFEQIKHQTHTLLNFLGPHARYRGAGVLIEHVSLLRFMDVAHIYGLPEVYMYISSLTDNEGAPHNLSV